jgi:nitrogen fixation protein NifX
MKVAFATENLADVDAHFGWARKVAIYEVQQEASRLLEVVEFAGELKEDGSEDKLLPKLEAIKDCAILYVAAIGGSAAAQVIRLGVHPVKAPTPEPIAGIIERLQVVLRGTPPPWLRKALLKGKERSFDFDAETETAADHV